MVLPAQPAMLGHLGQQVSLVLPAQPAILGHLGKLGQQDFLESLG
jgi:hypothetical protein